MTKILPRLILVVGVVAAWVLSFVTTVGSATNLARAEQLIEENEDLRTYKNVISLYDEVIAAHPDDISWYERKADAYFDMGWNKSYVEQCQRIVKAFPDELSGYSRLMDYYVSAGDYRNVIALYHRVPDALRNDEGLKAGYEQFEYFYQVASSTYQQADPIMWGYAAVESNGLYGYIDASLAVAIDFAFEDAHAIIQDAAAVKFDGEWFLIDMDGDRIRASHDVIQDLYSPSEGHALAKVDGKYGYYDDQLRDPSHFEYEAATSFANGIAAVCKEGKWALIDGSFNSVTDFIFDDVLVDRSGVCSNLGYVFAKVGDAYQLFDAKGNRVGSESFDDARLFRDDLAAVCKDGKWGFVNTAGEVVIDYAYEGADSFNVGIAPVAKGDLWGFVDASGKMVVEPTFSSASAITQGGISAVNTGKAFRYIQFYKYTLDER